MGEDDDVLTAPTLASGEWLGPDAEAHYLASRRLRINAYVHVARLLRNSRLLLAVALVTNSVLVASLIWLAARSRVIPYVIEVDRAGAAVAMGPAVEAAEPTRAMVVYALQLFVRSARTVTPDEAIQRRLILDTYAYAAGEAVTQLNHHFRRDPPFARAAQESVSPQVGSVLALDEETGSWRIEWGEVVSSRAGVELRTERWQALVKVSIDPPDEPEDVLTNPAGIRVTRFDWTRLPTA